MTGRPTSSMKFDTKEPCNSCPYRKDAPLGLWHPAEFENLAKTEKERVGAVFACHGSAKKPVRSVCAGWLLKQRDAGIPSIALRIMLLRNIRVVEALEQVSDGGFELFDSVTDMITANESLGRCARCGRYRSQHGHCPVHGEGGFVATRKKKPLPRKEPSLTERFEKIAMDAIDEAEGISCSLEDFRMGVEAMTSVFQQRLEQVDDELQGKR